MKVDRLALISLHTCPLAAPGQGKAGGMNVYLKELSQRIGSMGVKVDMFTRRHPGHDADVVDLDDNVRLVHLDGGPPDLPMNAFFSHLPGFLEDMERFRRLDGGSYDLVHSHYWLSGWVGVRAARRWGVPHVVTFHTLMEIKARARVGEDDSPHRSEVERELMATADLITASSPHEKSAMVRLYQAPEEKIRLLSCGVDLALFKPLDMEESRKRLGLNGEKVILFVGRIEPIKGLDLLLRSVAAMEETHIKALIVGGNMEQEAEVVRLKEMAQSLGIEESLEFVGLVDQRELPVYYNAADVCLVPSYYESFGLVALEALACGTPVVASRVGGLSGVVHHGRTGYLVSGRCPEPYADSVEMIFSNKALQKSMGKAARERAEGMGWERVAQDTLQLYREL